MVRRSIATLTAVMATSLAAPVPTPAQAQTQASPVSEQQTKMLNLTAYAELLRNDVQAQKIAILTEVMGFTEAEDKAFWPIYRDYNTEMAKLGDERVALIAEYTRAYSRDITDDVARSLATRAMDLDEAAERRARTMLHTRRLGAVAEDGAQVPAGRASAASDHRSADFGLAADRQVKRGRP